MEAAAYAEMRSLEDRHWWFRARRRLARPLVERALAEAPRPASAEIGCGTGGNLAHLLGGARPLLALDFDAGALRFCRERGLSAELLRADGNRLPLADGALGCVFAFDIIEHFDDDAALLAELARVLAPGGQLVASVPLYPWLWSPHDEFLHHRRRYRGGELQHKLAAAGFRVERAHGFNFLLLPPIALVRLAKAALGRARGAPAGGTDFFALPAPLEAALGALFALEAALVRALPIPFGVSLLVRARREARA